MGFKGRAEAVFHHLQGIPEPLGGNPDLMKHLPITVAPRRQGVEVVDKDTDQRPSKTSQCWLRFLSPANGSNRASEKSIEAKGIVRAGHLQLLLGWNAMREGIAMQHVVGGTVGIIGPLGSLGEMLKEYIPITGSADSPSQRSQMGSHLFVNPLGKAVTKDIDSSCCPPGCHSQGMDILPTIFPIADGPSDAVPHRLEPK